MRETVNKKIVSFKDIKMKLVKVKKRSLLKPIKCKKAWEENIKKVLSKSKDKKDEGIIEEFLNEKFEDWER